VEKVIKGNPFHARVITLNRYIPVPNPKTPSKLVLFLDVNKGIIDPFRGVEPTNVRKMVAYLQGASALKDAPVGDRLHYYFKHFNSPEPEVAADAFNEFLRADFKNYKEMAKKLPAEKLAGWLKDPKTPPQKLGLYASLLGLCGKAEHGALLRKLLDDPDKHKFGLDGVMVGYVSLQPMDGWKLVRSLLKDGQQEFLTRYSALRAVRFLRENRTDLISKKELEEGLALLLDQGDIADIAIEDLRKWKCWDMTDRILPLFGRESYDIPVVKRSILRFALQSPLASAANFVEAQRSRDPDWVRDTEELLKLE
jgi:hypothetical protein